MPLTAKQREKIQKRLLEERARAMADIEKFAELEAQDDQQERNSDLSKRPIHPADLATDNIDVEMEAGIATRKSAELAAIDDALDRLANSPETFGIDERSGEEIPFARLELIPWTRATVDSIVNH